MIGSHTGIGRHFWNNSFQMKEKMLERFAFSEEFKEKLVLLV